MNTIKQNEESYFNRICANIPPHKAPDLWPALEQRITARNPPPNRLACAYACAILLFLLPFAFAPVRLAAQNIVKKLFSCAYELTYQGSRQSGVLVLADGESKTLNMENSLLKIKAENVENIAVKFSVEIYEKLPGGALQLQSRPQIMTRRGTSAKISVGERGHTLYSLIITPAAEPDGYKASLAGETK